MNERVTLSGPAAARSVSFLKLAIAAFAILLLSVIVTVPGDAQTPRGMVETESVRAFMQTVAHDVTEHGPTAWLRYFEDGPAFFMAVNGTMAFKDSATAQDGTRKFAATNKHIELKWGDDLRVDPLAPGLAVVGASWHEVQIDTADHRNEMSGYFTAVAERRDGHWMFRDAHWSTAVPHEP